MLRQLYNPARYDEICVDLALMFQSVGRGETLNALEELEKDVMAQAREDAEFGNIRRAVCAVPQEKRKLLMAEANYMAFA